MNTQIIEKNINTGIPSEAREKIADGLHKLLADSYTLYLKTHNFHWNVTGPMFNALHLMFENQYQEFYRCFRCLLRCDLDSLRR